MRKLICFFLFVCSLLRMIAQDAKIPLPQNLPHGHPRLFTTNVNKEALHKQIATEDWAKEVYAGIVSRVDPYLVKTLMEPDWLYSRLMMYWKSHATNVYIKGGFYSHADGEALVPTVRFGSSRGVSSPVVRPKLEDVVPYMDDTKGVYFQNSAKEGKPLEWVDQSKVSGLSIESVNNEILRLGRDGAFLYWLTDDEKYGKFAYDVFDTYMTGMYYRNEPIDLGNGHAQTLVGMSTFEVIQEGILHDLAAYYDFLYPYIQKNNKEKTTIFEIAFKKWIDVTIKNGVPHNNWNLHQANIILAVAMVLEDDTNYADRKGREYYINQILNVSSPRQWSIPKLMEYGYDEKTGIWNECPGYAQSVTKEFMHFIQHYDNTFQQNLLPYTAVMHKAVEVLPQYLFPNGVSSAFGDSYYYKGLNTDAVADMIRMAQKHNNKDDEEKYTGLYKLLNPNSAEKNEKPSNQVVSFFFQKPLVLKDEIPATQLKEIISPVFYAPNVSWLIQRNNFESAENGMMISQYGSFGNHAHSNGIAIELYGKGYILGAESGIGSTYFEKPYLEYYSQFPAHNTVMVDGISKYPEMLSNHPFELLSVYPAPGQKNGFYPGITFSEVYFLEPESQSDQNRLLSILRTDDSTGYYVDIFRSKKQRAGDKFHDYFYHNLGQSMQITDTAGKEFAMVPSGEMAFAGGHLFALDYMWDKKSTKTDEHYKAVWEMDMPNGNHVYMQLWMKGYEGREVFSIKSPACKSFRGEHGFPYDVYNSPYLTIAARQHGQAWSHPFVSVFEPSSKNEPGNILKVQYFEDENKTTDFVGIKVKSKSGREDYIFSNTSSTQKVKYVSKETQAKYAVISEFKNGDAVYFMGNGYNLSDKNVVIETKEAANVVVEKKNGIWYYTSTVPVKIKIGKRTYHLAVSEYKEL